jgi:hypothetical protein
LFNKKHNKKIILIVLAISVVILVSFSYHLWCVGGAAGYLGGKLGGGRKTGARGRIRSIIVPVHVYHFHIHHWLLAIITLIICLITNFYVFSPQLFYGSMCGLAFQGIFCYDDWFRLIKKKIHQNTDQIEIASPGELESSGF